MKEPPASRRVDKFGRRRPGRRGARGLPWDRIDPLIEAGDMTDQQIASRFACARSLVSRRARQLGVPRRCKAPPADFEQVHAELGHPRELRRSQLVEHGLSTYAARVALDAWLADGIIVAVGCTHRRRFIVRASARGSR